VRAIDSAAAIDTLLGEARARREALHDLVARLRREQEAWNRDAATLPQRRRLTGSQRQRFRVHLLQLARRRAC
jgi:hypothetical protein